MKNISASEAARRFSDLINRVKYRGEEFIIERGGEAVCRLVPVSPTACTGASLKEHLRTIAKPDLDYWDRVADGIEKQPKTPESPW